MWLMLKGTPLASAGIGGEAGGEDVAHVHAVEDGAGDGVGGDLFLEGDGGLLEVEGDGAERNSMWEISSVAVLRSMSRYLAGPREPQAWKKYCMQTRISPSTPPMACWSMRAKMGLGFSTRTGN